MTAMYFIGLVTFMNALITHNHGSKEATTDIRKNTPLHGVQPGLKYVGCRHHGGYSSFFLYHIWVHASVQGRGNSAVCLGMFTDMTVRVYHVTVRVYH